MPLPVEGRGPLEDVFHAAPTILSSAVEVDCGNEDELSSATSSAIGSPPTCCLGSEGERLRQSQQPSPQETVVKALDSAGIWFQLEEDGDEDEESVTDVDETHREALDAICASAPTLEARTALVFKHLIGPPPQAVAPPPAMPQTHPQLSHLPWLCHASSMSPASPSLLRDVPTVSVGVTYASFAYEPDPANGGRMRRVKAQPFVPESVVAQRKMELRRIRRECETRVKRHRGRTAKSLIEADLPHLKSHISKRRIYQCLVCKSYSGSTDLCRHIGCKNHRVWAASMLAHEPTHVAPAKSPSWLTPSRGVQTKKKFVWTRATIKGVVH